MGLNMVDKNNTTFKANNALIGVYEVRLHDMEGQKIALHEKLEQIGKPIAPSTRFVEPPKPLCL